MNASRGCLLLPGPAVVEFAEAEAEVAVVAGMDEGGFADGQASAGEFGGEFVEEGRAGGGVEEGGEATGAVEGDDGSGEAVDGGAEGEPFAGLELLGAVEQEEVGRAHLADFGEEGVFVGAAGVEGEMKSARGEAEGGEAGGEFAEEEGFAGAGRADEGAAILGGGAAGEEGVPALPSGKAVFQAGEALGGKWIVAFAHVEVAGVSGEAAARGERFPQGMPWGSAGEDPAAKARGRGGSSEGVSLAWSRVCASGWPLLVKSPIARAAMAALVTGGEACEKAHPFPNPTLDP